MRIFPGPFNTMYMCLDHGFLFFLGFNTTYQLLGITSNCYQPVSQPSVMTLLSFLYIPTQYFGFWGIAHHIQPSLHCHCFNTLLFQLSESRATVYDISPSHRLTMSPPYNFCLGQASGWPPLYQHPTHQPPWLHLWSLCIGVWSTSVC